MAQPARSHRKRLTFVGGLLCSILLLLTAPMMAQCQRTVGPVKEFEREETLSSNFGAQANTPTTANAAHTVAPAPAPAVDAVAGADSAAPDTSLSAAVFKDLLAFLDRRKFELRCPATKSIMYNEAKAKGAKAVITGRAPPLPLWAPPGDKFLLMDCPTGGVSRRKLCLKTHMILAGLVNRTLVLNHKQYPWDLLLDVTAVRECFGPRTVVSLDELLNGGAAVLGGHFATSGTSASSFSNSSAVSALLCESAQPAPCDLLASPPSAPQALPQEWSEKDEFPTMVQRLLERKEAIVKVGGLPLDRMPAKYNLRGDIPFQRLPGCTRLAFGVIPHAAILSLALKSVETIFGRTPFLAVHWRRGADFMSRFCEAREDSPSSTATCLRESNLFTCIANTAKIVHVKHILLISDGPPNMVTSAKNFLGDGWHRLAVVANPPFNASDALSVKNMKVAVTEYHKLMMALAPAFLGSEASLFSVDVQRMRTYMGMETCMDSLICEGLPNRVEPFPDKKLCDAFL